MGVPTPRTSLEKGRDTDQRIEILEKRLAPPRPAIEATQLTLASQDPVTKRWFALGADGVTYGPLATNVSYLPVPGDKVWVVRNGAGEYVIGGAEQDWFPIDQLSGVTYNANNALSTFSEFEYCVRDGFVALRGLLAMSTTTPLTVLGVLPVGARPDTQMIFPVNNTDVARSVVVSTAGEIMIGGGGATINGFYSLDGIMFPAAGRATWTYVSDPGSGLAFVNGWGEFSGGTSANGKVGFWRDDYDMVWMRGLIAGGTASAGTKALTITNPDFLPWDNGAATGQKLFTTSNNVLGTLQATGNANIGIHMSGTNSNAWVSLNGLCYQTSASMAHPDWVEHPADRSFVNSWANYNLGYPTFAYRQRGDGMVMLKGMIKSGVIASNLDVLPSSFWPKKTLLIPTNSFDAMGRFDIIGYESDYISGARGLIRIQNGNNGWYSLSGKCWFPR